MFCSKCGSEIQEGTRFCSNCGQQVGESVVAAPQSEKMGAKVGKAVGAAADRLYVATGGEGHAQLKFRDFFTDVFKHHERGEAEELFVCGTSKTTPDISDVSSEWPKPWVWSRVLVVLLATLALLYMFLTVFFNPYGYPGVMFIGALAVPFATLIFFFETNIPRNISLVETVSIFFVGGVASLIAYHLLPESLLAASGVGDFGPSMLTGFLEEIAKAAIIVAVFALQKKRGLLGDNKKTYILNGLLIGAAVGAGFAVFETAGYIFMEFIQTYSNDSMTGTLVLRALLSIGGHVAWAAAEGAALALCEGDDGFEFGQIGNPKFLIVFALCVVLHGIWDMTVPILDVGIFQQVYAKYIILIIAIWIIIAVMLNRGLDQVNQMANAVSSESDEQ